jgi:K+-sensing histidine kinase KdpD
VCGFAQVETVVVEGDDVTEALVRYATESGVRSLVLGSVSFRWFQRCAIFPPPFLFSSTDHPWQVSSEVIELNPGIIIVH